MEDKILLAHGSGGKLSHDLISSFLPGLANPILNRLEDSAVFELSGRLAFTTDSFVVNPLFFPGGDIGKLAVCGTVNDLSMSGARPVYLSLAFIIEEGLPIAELKKIVTSIQKTAGEAGVKIVTGDTKVVNKGSADKLFINTAGVGVVPEGVNISAANARPGDKIIINGNIGDHGIAVLSRREGLKFDLPVPSDCAPLNQLVADMLAASKNIRCLRDPTRGGLATTLNDFAAQSHVGITIEEDKIPVDKAVLAACELLGFDPLYIANEGKVVAVVAPDDAEKVLRVMKRNKYGLKATIIGEVVAGHPGQVVMKTTLGASRIIDMPVGELLPEDLLKAYDTIRREEILERCPRIVVIGVGNLLLKDEGIGIHTIKALQEMELPEDIKLIDGGTAPDLIAYTEAGDKLIIIDAAQAGGEPGAVYRLRPQDLASENGKAISAHELGVEPSLRLLALMGNEPGEIVIIGVEPREIDWGTELSPPLQLKLPEIVKIVLREMGIDSHSL